jgi:hypothetical protein
MGNRLRPEGNDAMLCEAHLRRANKEVPATHLVADEPMCASCFAGRPINASVEERGAGGTQKSERRIYAGATPRSAYHSKYYRQNRMRILRRKHERLAERGIESEAGILRRLF